MAEAQELTAAPLALYFSRRGLGSLPDSTVYHCSHPSGVFPLLLLRSGFCQKLLGTGCKAPQPYFRRIDCSILDMLTQWGITGYVFTECWLSLTLTGAEVDFGSSRCLSAEGFQDQHMIIISSRELVRDTFGATAVSRGQSLRSIRKGRIGSFQS